MNSPDQAFSFSRPAAPVPVQPRVTCVPRSAAPAVQPAAPTVGDSLESWAATLTSLAGQLAGAWPPSAPAKPSWRRVPFPLAGRLCRNAQ